VEQRKPCESLDVLGVVRRAEHALANLDQLHQVAVRVAGLLDPLALKHVVCAASPAYGRAEAVGVKVCELRRPEPAEGAAEHGWTSAGQIALLGGPIEQRQELTFSVWNAVDGRFARAGVVDGDG